jgi:hypothetical protein
MEILSTIADWLSINYGWILSLFIQGFIAYHVFFLSKKLSNRARLEHKEKIKKKTEELLSKIHRQKLNSEVYLVNINRYFKDYPSNKEKRFEGYSHIKAEIKSTGFDGVQFFSEMPIAVYQKSNGQLAFKGGAREKVFNTFPVGLVPYEWIEHIDLDGDEYAYVPLFYCHFKGKTNWQFWRRLLFFGYPYKRTDYYKKNEVYHEGSDPVDMKYRFIDQKIYKK